jgi:hypothetical protein
MSAGMMLLAIIGGIVVLGFGGCVVCMGLGAAGAAKGASSARERAEAKTAETPALRAPQLKAQEKAQPSSAPQVEVTANALWNAYHANEVSADDLYKGKQLLVSGTVAKISKDFADNIVIQLATPNQFQHVSATLNDDEKANASKLAKGEAVKVSCVGRGLIVGTPMLKDCALQ